MKLFDETESKYYELISYLLLQNRSFTRREVSRLYQELFPGEEDYETLDALFPVKEGEEVLFSFESGQYHSVTNSEFPIRCSAIEKQAFRTLPDIKNAEMFLEDGTLRKMRNVEGMEVRSWTPGDIKVKNQFDACGPDLTEEKSKLPVISKAIIEGRSIIFDNVREGVYEYKNTEAFPARIEYSFINDQFRISAYLPSEDRFFKMTLDTMCHIKPGKRKREDIQEKYRAFLKSNKKRVLLDVEPTGHVIERCFRIFSYYERKAVYNRDDNRYRLEIHYHSFDEAEVIRDILSLGSSVTVMEPGAMRKKVFRRILEASKLY